jgi:hypothetical protein
LAAAIPPTLLEMLAAFPERFRAVLDDDRDFRRLVADYPDPVGEQMFRSTLTAGSQQGLVLLLAALISPLTLVGAGLSMHAAIRILCRHLGISHSDSSRISE